MVPVLLALVTAGCYGCADFLGGSAARGNPTRKVLLAAHGTSLVVLAAVVALMRWPQLVGDDLTWSMAAAVCCLAGLLMLYRGLGGGPMAIVSAVSAVLSAAVPVLVGVASGESLGLLGWSGVALGMVATALVSVGAPSHADHRDPRWLTLLLAVGAGSGIGGMLSCLAQASEGAGLLPLVVVRAVSVVCLLVAGVALGRSLRPSALLPGHAERAALAGTLDAAGTGLFMLAAMSGPLSVLAVLAAQYPVVTVGLARWRLGERLVPRQLVGLVAALVAVGLLAVA